MAPPVLMILHCLWYSYLIADTMADVVGKFLISIRLWSSTERLTSTLIAPVSSSPVQTSRLTRVCCSFLMKARTSSTEEKSGLVTISINGMLDLLKSTLLSLSSLYNVLPVSCSICNCSIRMVFSSGRSYFVKRRYPSFAMGCFRGIKQISEGVHLIHLTNQLSNTRTARFVRCKEQQVVLLAVIDGELEVESVFVGNELVHGKGQNPMLEHMLPFMVNYSSFENNQWPAIGLNIDYGKFVSVQNGWFSDLITSSDTSTTELLELQKVIQFDMNQQNGELKLTQTNPKAVLKHTKLDLTTFSVDKSQFFAHLFTMDSFMNEHNFSFIGLLTLNNWSCLEQWYNLTNLVLECVQLVLDNGPFYQRFLDLLQKQLDLAKSITEEFIKVHRLVPSLKVFLVNMESFPYAVQFQFGSFMRFLDQNYDISLTYKLDEISESEDE
ncbi:hypothetical protein OGAPHI_005482 [Ogataea philodendri]|uniref:Uncharacterized protein n=2 Tax=Saccharomycotina TaxID=147537 RepID=A0A9P8P052_9ASCO|nr:uncharacterized protein OGAPHI_005482 [Ogataea philodendri]KAH3662234.1 hypothetical protein OGAPHI_005482 [Ogataea philodendri]